MDYQLMLDYIYLIAKAHQEKVNQYGKTQRKLPAGNENPYFLHPLWCFTMILHEPLLPDSVRIPSSFALLFHDIVEDTTVPLPQELSSEVKSLIGELTVSKEAKYNFSSWEKEKQTILQKPPQIQLLKLYDKTATLLDMVIKEDRIREWSEIVSKMAENVEKSYGELNIVLLAKTLTAQRLKELDTNKK